MHKHLNFQVLLKYTFFQFGTSYHKWSLIFVSEMGSFNGICTIRLKKVCTGLRFNEERKYFKVNRTLQFPTRKFLLYIIWIPVFDILLYKLKNIVVNPNKFL